MGGYNYMNILNFTDNLTNSYNLDSKFQFVTASNVLTAFFVDISLFISTDIDEIEINLINVKTNESINFKEIVADNTLYTDENYLYYTNTSNLTQDIDGKYYLEITDGQTTFVSYFILFDLANKISDTSTGYFKMYFSDDFVLKLKGTGSCLINFGDATSETVSLSEIETTISHSYSSNHILTIYNAENITSLQCNSSSLYKVSNEENLKKCETVNISNTSLTSFYYNRLNSLLYIYQDNTRILCGNLWFGFGNNKIKIFSGNGCLGIHTQEIVNAGYNSLEELYLSGCSLTSISTSLPYGSDIYRKLKIIDLSDNKIIAIPQIGIKNYSCYCPLETLILSNNDIRYTSSNLLTLQIYGRIIKSKLDLKNNSFVDSNIDKDLLFPIGISNQHLNGLYIDLSGQSLISGIKTSAPVDEIEFYKIINGGIDYVVGDSLTITNGDESGTGASCKISAISQTGAITSLSNSQQPIFNGNKGTGYNQVQNFTGGSGKYGNIEFYSCRNWLVMKGVELYTNAELEVEELPDNSILDMETKKYLKTDSNYVIENN